MSSYRPMSVSEAAAIIAPKIGLTVEDNYREVITFLNRYRNLLYNRYDRQRLFDNVWHCFCPSRFHNLCSTCNPCDRCFLGFTLPREMAGVVQAWEWNFPLRLRSSWRESFTGRAPSGGAFGDLVEVRENFPTERDLKRCSTVQIFSESFSDRGKKVIVEGKNTDHKVVKEEFTLEDGTVVSTNNFAKVYNVILPAGRQGGIIISDSEGYELSRYSPSEPNIPAYKRYKLPGTCHTNVLVQGTRQLIDVWFDTDIVEIGDRMVLEFMGTYFKYYESSDPREFAKAQAALANAYQNLDGLVARDDGGKLPQPTIHNHPKRSLPGYGKCYP